MAPIKTTINLSSRAPNRWTFGTIEKSELDAGFIGDPAHQPIKRINFSNKMAFTQPPDRWVAGHNTNIGERIGDQRRFCTQPSGSGSRLTSGVPGSDYHDIISLFHRLQAPARNRIVAESKCFT
jgi:hypothetical protein